MSYPRPRRIAIMGVFMVMALLVAPLARASVSVKEPPYDSKSETSYQKVDGTLSGTTFDSAGNVYIPIATSTATADLSGSFSTSASATTNLPVGVSLLYSPVWIGSAQAYSRAGIIAFRIPIDQVGSYRVSIHIASITGSTDWSVRQNVGGIQYGEFTGGAHAVRRVDMHARFFPCQGNCAAQDWFGDASMFQRAEVGNGVTSLSLTGRRFAPTAPGYVWVEVTFDSEVTVSGQASRLHSSAVCFQASRLTHIPVPQVIPTADQSPFLIDQRGIDLLILR